jgi:signal transduction histidine kinase
MKPQSSGLSRRYQAALGQYLKQGPAASLQPATRLGRQAVALGLETLDLALLHEQALLARVLPNCSPKACDQLVKRAGRFFAEAITPLEQTHRLALESNARLSRVNQTLNHRTVELAASNRKLKKEVVQRQAVEESLRQSEQQSSRLLEQSRRLQEQLRQLSRRILLAQEEERKRISRELHEVIAQVLTGINMQLATLKNEAALNTSGLDRKISRTQRLVVKSVDIVHRFARELRPAVLDDLGLIPALHSLMKSFAKETGLRVSLTAFAGVEALDSARRTVLYRVAQEALTNVARHAHASRVDASLHKLSKAVGMTIKDDGRSFEVERVFHAKKGKRLGLLGMRERVEMVGGTFSVESTPRRGTTIQVRIPFGNGRRGGGLVHEASARSAN